MLDRSGLPLGRPAGVLRLTTRWSARIRSSLVGGGSAASVAACNLVTCSNARNADRPLEAIETEMRP